MELYFADGFSIVKINVNGYDIRITIQNLGINNIPIEKTFTVRNVKSILKECPDFEGLPVDKIVSMGKERFRKKILELKTEENIRKYIIIEMEAQGLKYLGKWKDTNGLIFSQEICC